MSCRWRNRTRQMNGGKAVNERGLPAKIIFDMDGVITGEERYWDAAALVVWELFFSPRYLGLTPPGGLPPFQPDPSPGCISVVRRFVFDEDRTVAFFKRKAVNSNWDLAFLVFSFHLIRLFRELQRCGGILSAPSLPNGEEPGIAHLWEWGNSLPAAAGERFFSPSAEEAWAEGARGELELMARLTRLAPPPLEGLLERMLRPHSLFWRGLQRIFQEWYFGGEKYAELYGEKPLEPAREGLIHREEPLLPVGEIEKALRQIKRQGWVLGIATGRPRNELYPPLKQMGLWDCFDPRSIATFTEVEEAEQRMNAGGKRLSLRKPHPFSFLKAYFGDKEPEREMISRPFRSLPAQRCWVVGDALADLVAAREMGASFIGVLTGHGGSENRALFQREGADAVLPDVTAVPGFLAEKGATA